MGNDPLVKTHAEVFHAMIADFYDNPAVKGVVTMTDVVYVGARQAAFTYQYVETGEKFRVTVTRED